MQLNKTTIIKEFRNFLDSISLITDNYLNVASFSFKIPEIKIVTLLSSNIIKNEDNFYWKIQDEDLEFLAFSPILNINENGDTRLESTSARINDIESNFVSNWKNCGLQNIPLIVGGIKFAPAQKSERWDDFSDSDWFVPKILILKKGDEVYIVYNFIVDINLNINIKNFENILNLVDLLSSTSNELESKKELLPYRYSNSFDQWQLIINKGLKKISEGMLSKVVLSREVCLDLSNENSISTLINELSEKYPRCYIFVFQRAGSLFIGASPEKLAKVSDGWIEVDALAGSAPRGKSDIEDVEMEYFLLNSEKNLFEQRAVVNFIHNLLNKISDEIIFDDKPMIRKLPNIQHLWTIMKAKLNSEINVIDLLPKLHPTPAICGDPWKIAKDFILENEVHDRGLYSGNIGWFNFEGSGEFAVAIRSGLIKSNKLFAYAGCGIVEGSEPIAEYEESEIKLKPILSLFVDEKVYQP